MLINRIARETLLAWLYLGSVSLGFSNVALATEPAIAQVRLVIDAAKVSHREAGANGHAWSITSAFIDDAEAQLLAQRTELAMIAAQRALKTANASVEQAKAESTAWQTRIPSKQK